MIDHFEDFCLYMFVTIDDNWNQIKALYKRPGPEPRCSDSELITMVLVGECRGWDLETDLLSHWREYRHLFPHCPSQSRFNRRRRHLYRAFNQIRQRIVSQLDLAYDPHCVIDSLPIEVVRFHLVPASTGDWAAHGARFGKIQSKKQMIYGYKLHLLIAGNGLIRDFELTSANISDLEAGLDILYGHPNLTVFGDKAYISQPAAEALALTNRTRLLTLPRRNQKKQVPKPQRRRFNRFRQIIETVNSQLVELFNIETNHAHTFMGLCTRLHAKLTAHTLCIYINRLIGEPNLLHIKKLAFPN